MGLIIQLKEVEIINHKIRKKKRKMKLEYLNLFLRCDYGYKFEKNHQQKQLPIKTGKIDT